jgi:hypothetical protein
MSADSTSALPCRHEPYNLKVDVYSFAMIIFQLFETTTPFHGHDPVDAARQAAMLGARPGFPPRRNLTAMTTVRAWMFARVTCYIHHQQMHAPPHIYNKQPFGVRCQARLVQKLSET